MWGWEWYQPTTLMGRPVISANLCGSQGALGTERQREELYVQGKTAEFYKFLMSQQNSRSLWRGGKTVQGADGSLFPSTIRSHCCRSKLDSVCMWQQTPSQQLLKPASPSVCGQEAPQCSTWSLADLSSSTQPPCCTATPLYKHTAVLPVTKYKTMIKNL